MKLRAVLAVLVLMGLSVVLHHVRATTATDGWSEVDPGITIGGVRQSIAISLPDITRDRLRGPVQLTVRAPAAYLVAQDRSVQGSFAVILHVESAGPDDSGGRLVTLQLSAAADAPIPLQLTVTGGDGRTSRASGTSAAPPSLAFAPRS